MLRNRPPTYHLAFQHELERGRGTIDRHDDLHEARAIRAGRLIKVGILAHPGGERAKDLAAGVHEADGGQLVLQRTLIHGTADVIDVGERPGVLREIHGGHDADEVALAPLEPARAALDPAPAPPVATRPADGAKSFGENPFSASKRWTHRCSCRRCTTAAGCSRS